jgi:hypothetical protein
MVGSILIALLVSTTVAMAQAANAGAQAPEAVTASSGDAANEPVTAAVAKAITTATLPQLTAARGGSLGIPSAGAVSGLQANVDAQLFGEKANADAFAQLGGLRIDRFVNVDVFAELLDQDLPRFLHDRGTVHAEMFTPKLSAAGMRIRIHREGVLLVSDLQSSECLTSITNAKRTRNETAISLLRSPQLLDGDIKSACKLDRITGETSTTFTLGVHVLRRSSVEAGGVSSNGAAAELMVQHEGARVAVFAGVSGIWLTGAANDKAGASIVEFPTIRTLRMTAGIEYRGQQSLAAGIVPRVGAYAVAGHAWWHDAYTFGTLESKIQSTEAEVGIFAGGKFSDKFSGILALRVLRPFGTKQDTMFILSLMPSASSSSQVVQP